VGQPSSARLPDGPFTLFIEVYGGPDNKKLLAGHRAIGERNTVPSTRWPGWRLARHDTSDAGRHRPVYAW
jgi:hypothetical protein